MATPRVGRLPSVERPQVDENPSWREYQQQQLLLQQTLVAREQRSELKPTLG